MLRERPPVAGAIFGSVLPLTERHIRRRFDDMGATFLRVLEMMSDVNHCHMYVSGDLVPARWPKRSTLPPDHDGAVAERELRVANDPVAFSTKPFCEAEYPTEPLDRLAHVFVDEDRDDRRIWCGTVSNHSVWPGPNEN